MQMLSTLWFHAVWFVTHELGRGLRHEIRREEGQTTAEYALVILAAAAVAVVLIAWARSSGRLPAFFDQVIDQVIGDAAGA
jgi:Flp pilus assembly pilin Flp